jgi:ABC-type bacteriocin/lantibiotic exporter with double-glycine peptidase domain
MTNLKSVSEGYNKFCGPAVLSILTGKNTDECANAIGYISGEYNIKGVKLEHLLAAANRLGFTSTKVDEGTSLYGTIIRLVNDDGMYIVTVPNHFVVIEVNNKKAYFCDNHTKEPIPAASSARLSQRVVAVHKVSRKKEPVLVKEYIKLHKVQTTNSISIRVMRVSEFDEGEPNHSNLGIIVVKNETELNELIDKIKESSYE